jgi:hypothetical protein
VLTVAYIASLAKTGFSRCRSAFRQHLGEQGEPCLTWSTYVLQRVEKEKEEMRERGMPD